MKGKKIYYFSDISPFFKLISSKLYFLNEITLEEHADLRTWYVAKNTLLPENIFALLSININV